VLRCRRPDAHLHLHDLVHVEHRLHEPGEAVLQRRTGRFDGRLHHAHLHVLLGLRVADCSAGTVDDRGVVLGDGDALELRLCLLDYNGLGRL
jgi:hypothetical protein